MKAMPWWLKLILGILPLPIWLKVVIEIAYEIWELIPWKEKSEATRQLRNAVKLAKHTKKTEPIAYWTEEWRKACAAKGRFPG